MISLSSLQILQNLIVRERSEASKLMVETPASEPLKLQARKRRCVSVDRAAQEIESAIRKVRAGEVVDR